MAESKIPAMFSTKKKGELVRSSTMKRKADEKSELRTPRKTTTGSRSGSGRIRPSSPSVDCDVAAASVTSKEQPTSKNEAAVIPDIIMDTVHGPMHLHPLLIAIIDTKPFQRLRKLEQLGCVRFVYPSAGLLSCILFFVYAAAVSRQSVASHCQSKPHEQPP